MCTRRVLVNFKGSLLLKIIYKCRKHYNYLQTRYITNKFASIKVIKTHMYRHQVIRNAKLFKVWIKFKLFIDLGLTK